MDLLLSKYGDVIATDEKSSKIYEFLKTNISGNDKIIIDASNVTISTKSSRLIFGKLYKELKSKVFLEKISFKNASALFMFSVNEGIATELEN